MGRAKQVLISGKVFEKQGDALAFFKERKKELLPGSQITSGELYDALYDVYVRYCNNSPGYELNGRLIIAFSVNYERRKNGDTWATHPCYKVHFSNDEVRPFSIDKAVKSIAQNR